VFSVLRKETMSKKEKFWVVEWLPDTPEVRRAFPHDALSVKYESLGVLSKKEAKVEAERLLHSGTLFIYDVSYQEHEWHERAQSWVAVGAKFCAMLNADGTVTHYEA
jgi:hypothetical protein